MEMKTETKCPFWQICGGAIVYDYWAKQTFPYGDQRREYIKTVCCGENKYLECERYKIRTKPKEVEKNETE